MRLFARLISLLFVVSLYWIVLSIRFHFNLLTNYLHRDAGFSKVGKRDINQPSFSPPLYRWTPLPYHCFSNSTFHQYIRPWCSIYSLWDDRDGSQYHGRSHTRGQSLIPKCIKRKDNKTFWQAFFNDFIVYCRHQHLYSNSISLHVWLFLSWILISFFHQFFVISVWCCFINKNSKTSNQSC